MHTHIHTAVKFVIFMTFWQSLAISICDSLGWIPDSSYWTAENIALSVQSLLIIVEMVVASVWHTHHNCFGYQPFTNAGAFGSTSLATLSASASTFASSTAAFSTQRLGASAKDTTNPWRSLLDIFNPAETMREIVNGGRYFIARWVLWWRKTHAGHEPIVDQRTPDLDERDDGPGEGGAGGEAVLDMQLPAERRRGDVYEEQTRALTGV